MAKSLAQIRSDWGKRKWAKYVHNENDERAVLSGHFVDERFGQHVCEFAKTYCRHAEGKWAGKPFEFTKWQRDRIIMPLYSWFRPSGLRRFTSADVWMAKKNGKSALCSVLGLYGLVGEDVPGAKVYAAAVDRDQASIVFDAAMAMVNASPALGNMLDVVPSRKRIVKDDSSWFQALSAESAKHEGLKAFYVIVDEIHVFDERARKLYETLRYSGASFDQPLAFVISTAGEDETGVGYEQYKLAKDILEGNIIDPTAFVSICEAEKEDDPGKVGTWRKANPMLGEILSVDEMRTSWSKAKAVPTRLAAFKRYRCNQWIKTSEPWLDMGHWAECGGELCDLQSEPCWAGVDCGATTDMTSLCLCYPLDDGEFAFRWWYWLPEEMTDGGSIVKRGQRDGAPYAQWARDGWLTLTPGNATDYGFIDKTLLELAETEDLRRIAYDPWAFRDRATTLQETHGLNMVEMRQGYASLSGPSKEFEKLVLSGRALHGDNPISRVQAARVTVAKDPAGNIKPIKGDGKKKWYRIDGIVAAIMALGVAMLDNEGEYVLDEEGLCIVG